VDFFPNLRLRIGAGSFQALTAGRQHWDRPLRNRLEIFLFNPLLFLAKQLFDSNLTVIMFYSSFKLIRAKIVEVFLAT
jgi:hypothetical protein